jgi:shikimate kinase
MFLDDGRCKPRSLRGDPATAFSTSRGRAVIRVLLTGMSGVGKSTLVHELSSMGYKAVDLDSEEWSEWGAVDRDEDPAMVGTPVEPDRDWVWREDRVRRLLGTEDTDLLFVSGCASNMGTFRASFDHQILLTAPREVIVQRLASRTANDYGKEPEELARVMDLIDIVEPLLRSSADHVIDTAAPLPMVVARVLGIARPDAARRTVTRSRGTPRP